MQLQFLTSTRSLPPPPPEFSRFGETESAADSFSDQEILRPESRRIFDEDAPRRPVDRRSPWAEAYSAYRNDTNRQQNRQVANYQRPAPRNFTTTGFAAQRIAQENLAPGAYYESFGPAINAYSRPTQHSENMPPGSIINMAA